jgi:hypothetical protein
MMAVTDPIQKVVDVLQSVGSYRLLTKGPFRERGSSFDTILAGDDPMSIILVEHRERPDADFLKHIARELRTLVWSLFNEGKRHMVSVVLVLGAELPEHQMAELTKSLSGTCRIYTVSTNMSSEELKTELVSLGTPEFFKVPLTETGADKLTLEMSTIKGKAKQEFALQLVELVKGSGSAQEVSRKLLNSYGERIREVENAAAEPQD